jgi:hypothetical protein
VDAAASGACLTCERALELCDERVEGAYVEGSSLQRQLVMLKIEDE